MNLPEIIGIDSEKCVNCHQCISTCPVKFANNGAGETIEINHNLCIGCGQCVEACSHNARYIIDDTTEAFKALANKEKIIAIAAPAVAAAFPEQYLLLNGWLKSMGVEAVFDVSFGAELTVKSYLEFVKNNKPKTIIAQPCPAIVTYIQTYKPELIEHLAPAHSPMLHTIKMIEQFYPKFSKHKIMVISPCIAKKREFDETNLGNFNTTFSQLNKIINDKNIDLSQYPEIPYINASAERATLFSSPGGLMETVKREAPEIEGKIRKIEGPQNIYKYLDSLKESINKGFSPLLVDCLNCHEGCNGGTATGIGHSNIDELEHNINLRALNHIKAYKNKKEDLQKAINQHWIPGLYNRSYVNLNDNLKNKINEPDENAINEIYESLYKFSKDDLHNCSSCGYNSCKDMAVAIFNNINRKENCHYYNQNVVKEKNKKLDSNMARSIEEIMKQNEVMDQQKKTLINQSEEVLKFIQNIQELIN